MLVGNLLAATTKAEVWELCGWVGRVQEVVLMGSKRHAEAFVVFQNPHEAAEAVDRLNGKHNMGRELQVCGPDGASGQTRPP